MSEVKLTGASEGRGRNGWFTPARVNIEAVPTRLMSATDYDVVVEISSERTWNNMPPIYLRLVADDAVRLLESLSKAVDKANP